MVVGSQPSATDGPLASPGVIGEEMPIAVAGSGDAER